jgi:hypothetical protein
MSTKFCATHYCAATHPSRETRESGAGDSASTLRERRRRRSLEALLQSTKIFAWHPIKPRELRSIAGFISVAQKGNKKFFVFLLKCSF